MSGPSIGNRTVQVPLVHDTPQADTLRLNNPATNCYFYDAADAHQPFTGSCGLYQAGWDSLWA